MATPMIGDIELKAVQWIRQETDQDFVRQRVAGLDGTLHQALGRRSHRVMLAGVFLPDTATDDLKKLQDQASAGAEVSFTADITTALSIDKMVIESFAAEQQIGPAGQFSYHITLAESPPLPPPAEVSSFGGLGGAGGFGLGDLGFDAGALGDVLGDVASQAGAITGAIDAATDAIGAVSALSSLGNLANIGNPIKPLTDKVGDLGKLGAPVSKLTSSLGGLFS